MPRARRDRRRMYAQRMNRRVPANRDPSDDFKRSCRCDRTAGRRSAHVHQRLSERDRSDRRCSSAGEELALGDRDTQRRWRSAPADDRGESASRRHRRSRLRRTRRAADGSDRRRQSRTDPRGREIRSATPLAFFDVRGVVDSRSRAARGDASRAHRAPARARAARARAGACARGRELAARSGTPPSLEQIGADVGKDLRDVAELFCVGRTISSLDARRGIRRSRCFDQPWSKAIGDRCRRRRPSGSGSGSRARPASARGDATPLRSQRRAVQSLAEIGRDLGITRERVRQIQEEALKRLGVISVTQDRRRTDRAASGFRAPEALSRMLRARQFARGAERGSGVWFEPVREDSDCPHPTLSQSGRGDMLR